MLDWSDDNPMIAGPPTNNRLPFSDNDDNVPHLSHTRSTAGQIEDVFFDNYVKFFKTAEDRRRWDIDRDIPWDLSLIHI